MKINFAITTDSSLGSDAIISQFLQYNQWTDSNSNNSYQKGCSSNSKDFWTTNLDTCKTGYIKASAGAQGNGETSCLIFSEWNSGQVTSRYSSRPQGCSINTGSPDFFNVLTAINAYYAAFSSYSTQNRNLINNLQSQFNNLNTGFTSMSNQLLTLLNSINGIIEPLVKIFKEFIGDAGIFQLVNCSNLLLHLKF
jgi:hypothetical protein